MSDTNYNGTIIQESLVDTKVLGLLTILKTDVEAVTEHHKTPWIKQWTLHVVSIPTDQADNVAETLSQTLDPDHSWYADFKNHDFHYIIFRNKVFKVDRSKPEQYHDVTKFGITLGIPDYQLDFSPHISEWQR
ncbi:MAG: hypothetical protein WAV40_03425 [Microgenomates group bacterium]